MIHNSSESSFRDIFVKDYQEKLTTLLEPLHTHLLSWTVRSRLQEGTSALSPLNTTISTVSPSCTSWILVQQKMHPQNCIYRFRQTSRDRRLRRAFFFFFGVTDFIVLKITFCRSEFRWGIFGRHSQLLHLSCFDGKALPCSALVYLTKLSSPEFFATGRLHNTIVQGIFKIKGQGSGHLSINRN